MRLTDRVCDKFAGLGFRVAEIAETAMTQAPAAKRRDLSRVNWAPGSGEIAWAMLIATITAWVTAASS